MKSCVALCVYSLTSIAAFAQLNPLPPSSLADGILVQANATSPSKASWAASSLFNYRLAGGNPFSTPAAGSIDGFGNAWTASAPSLSGIANNGGTLRAIFLGAAGSEVQGIGYSYDTSPDASSSFTLAGAGGPHGPDALSFGDWADLPLSVHEADSFDFWVSTAAGAYTVLDPNNRLTPATQRTDILWTEEPLLVSTFIPALGSHADVETWIVSVLEYSADQQLHTEFRFALQQFERSGSAFALDQNGTPVPEPSTYAIAGGVVCALLALCRRTRNQS